MSGEGEDELRATIRLALAQWVVVPLSHLGYIADALLPVVLADRERHVRQRAAEELRAAADGSPCCGSTVARRHLRDRADTLSSEATP